MKNIIKTKYNCLKEFKKGELITLASRPDAGKTLFAFNIAVNVASQNKKVKIFNMEWSSKQLEEQIDIIKSPYHNKNEIIESNLRIITNPNLKLNNIFEESKGYDLIIIDSITIISGTNKQEKDSKVLEQIMLKLKNIAKSLNVAMIIISELPRDVDEREDRHPIISDLSEYIIDNTDRVVFMYKEWFLNSNNKNGITELKTININNSSQKISYLSRSKNRVVFKNISK